MRHLLVILAWMLLPMAAQAEPSMCKFGGYDGKATTVDLAAIYRAADVVVTGKVTGRENDGSDLTFAVDKTIKGMPARQIVLHGQQRINTEMNGFVLPGNRDMVLFLKAGTGGVFENVEDYNSPCNIITFIREGKVVLVEHDEHNAGVEVAVDKLKDYLDANPPKLVFNYQ